ncbi:MAG: thiamine-monophosphate kinase [Nitrospiraceae bacterium]|nr:MAG: thiamine-monophosphate kinase [Nitrospiraceae bacterium]
MKLSDTGELSLLKTIRRRFAVKSKDIIAGIGDDTAVIKPSGRNLLATTDMMVEGIHFDLNLTTPYQLGFKLVSVNVSDIYAMGGRPQYLLLDIALNKNTEQSFVDRFFDGIRDAMRSYGVFLIGGDISSSRKDMVFAATLIGDAKKHIKRSGAKPGDRIYVTGHLGDSACGLEILKKAVSCLSSASRPRRQLSTVSRKLNAKDYPIISKFKKMGLTWDTIYPMIERHLMPIARNPKGFAEYATSMIDLSDGLFIDLSRLCDESKTGAKIFIERIPVSSKMRTTSSLLGLDAIKLACSGGEDYELLFTAPSNKKINAVYIGDIVKSGRKIIDTNGREKKFSASGYKHFENQR